MIFNERLFCYILDRGLEWLQRVEEINIGCLFSKRAIVQKVKGEKSKGWKIGPKILRRRDILTKLGLWDISECLAWARGN